MKRSKNQSKTAYTIVLEYANAMTRSVRVVASSREVAENRALKRNPAAIGVKKQP